METAMTHSDNNPKTELRRTREGNYELGIRGKLPHGWVVNLTAGMGSHGISIKRGMARKVNGMTWEAQLEIVPGFGGTDPERLDFLELARKGALSSAKDPLALKRYTLTENRLRGALCLDVRADDRTGFLGAFLDRLSFFSLFPEEMQIETVGSTISDRFWLKGVGGQVPSPAVVSAVKKNLDALVVGS